MNWKVILLEMLFFACFFTVCVFLFSAGERKHRPASIHNYPPEIQEEYFKTHEKVDVSYKSKSVILTKGIALVVYMLIIYFCARLAGARTFGQGFLFGFGLMAWIGIYDTCFIDWVLFANMKMFRLEGTEHMDEAYHQKWFHAKGALFPGSLFALIAGALVGLMVMLVH